MKSLILSAFAFIFSLSLSAQIRIDSSFAFGPNPAKKYSIYIPSNYNPSAANPMMVGFHPFNVNRWDAQSWCDTLLNFSEMNDLILVCPDGDSTGIITDSIDYAFTSVLIDSMKKWYNVDANRIYAIGFSMGGKAVYEYGLSHAETFGGFIPVGPAINGTTTINDVIHNAGKRPFYLVHGSQDMPSVSFFPLLAALYGECAFVDSTYMPGVGHTIDFPNRNQILSRAYQWVDSVHLAPISGLFSLHFPLTGSGITSKGFADYSHAFEWGESSVQDTCGVLKYEVMFDVPGGSFSNPVLTLAADNGGVDTTLTLTNAIIDQILDTFSIPINGILSVDWTVRSNINNQHSDTAKSFNILFTRKKLGFSVSAPSNKTYITLTNGGSQFFDWEDMNHYISVRYHLMFDDTSGNFLNPKQAYLSNTNGKSSSVTIDHERLYYDFMFKDSKKVGDTIAVKWAVQAADSVYSEFSKNDREIYFIMGDVGFKLFGPADGSIINSKKGVNYNFSWDSVLLSDIRYEWRFDTLNVDLKDTASFVWESDSDSLEAGLELTFEIMDSMMNFYGIPYRDTLFGQWTVRALFDTNETYALNTYKVTIVRAHPVGIEDIDEALEVVVFPNPANDQIQLIWNNQMNWEQLSIFDSQGRLVLQKVIKENQDKLQIDVSTYSDGSYLWRMTNDSAETSGTIIISR